MNRPPAFQFYPKDWRDFKVRRMSYEAQGIYMAILCDMWNDSRDWCSIIDDNKAISKALGISIKKWLSIKKEIQYENDPLLRKNGNKLISLRLKKEAKKLKEFRRKQSEKGKKSAKSRGTTVEPRLNYGSTDVPTGRQPEGNSLSSSSSSSIKEKKKTRIYKIFPNLSTEKWEGIEEKDIKRWEKTYSLVDVDQTLKEMIDWLLEDNSRAHNYVNFKSFISGWLRRNNEKAAKLKPKPEFPRFNK